MHTRQLSAATACACWRLPPPLLLGQGTLCHTLASYRHCGNALQLPTGLSWPKVRVHAYVFASARPPARLHTCQGGGARLPFLQRDSASSLTPGPAGSAPPSEVERLAAAKSTKELLAKGISLFNTKGPLKGIEALIANNLVESSPAAVRERVLLPRQRAYSAAGCRRGAADSGLLP